MSTIDDGMSFCYYQLEINSHPYAPEHTYAPEHAIREYIEDNDCYYPIIDNEYCNWFDQEEDMKELSKCFHKILFKLIIDRDNGDRHIIYYQNGKIFY